MYSEEGKAAVSVAICQLAFMIGKERIQNIWISSDLNCLLSQMCSVCTFQFLQSTMNSSCVLIQIVHG